MNRIKNAMRRLWERSGSMRQKMGWMFEGAGSLFDFGFFYPAPPPTAPATKVSTRAQAKSTKRERCADDSCNSIADPRCKGLNCTMHCAIFCQGRCGVPRPPNFTYKRRVPVSKMKDPTPPPSDSGGGYVN